MQHIRESRFDRFPVRDSERPKAMFEYYVSGYGEFPFDMLRYDSAWPSSSEDAAAMGWTRINGPYPKIRSVLMRSYREPTIERWASFGWSVGNEKL